MANNGYLDGVTYKDTVPFVPPVTLGRIVKVYDGDTLTLATKLPTLNPDPDAPVYRFQVRLAGIDCPEMKTSDPNEKTVAIMAKEAIQSRVLHQVVTLENVELEKYGRLLARVHHEGQCLNDLLCASRLAVPYDGGTKRTPSNWLVYYNDGTM